MRNADNLIFPALADPTRRQIQWLHAGDSPTPTELACRLPIIRQAVSKHLRELEDAGLVVSGKEGRETWYSATNSGLDPAAVWLAERSADRDNRLARLSDFATRDNER